MHVRRTAVAFLLSAACGGAALGFSLSSLGGAPHRAMPTPCGDAGAEPSRAAKADVGEPFAPPKSAPPPRPDQARPLPPVQIIEHAHPPQYDAVPTGGPYFAYRLHRMLRDAGLPAGDIQISVTRAAVILKGEVSSQADRAEVADLVRRNSPEQLEIENRIVVVPRDERPR
jgi:hypothetical protein